MTIQEAILLHNKAIEILEKRSNALHVLSEWQAGHERWDNNVGNTRQLFDLDKITRREALYARYIRLLTRAYGKLAASVCESAST